ncbi:MAG: MoaD/ThiS family protein [Candidatus Nezhaarchaeota archaeon]|nr:MoaD/ThiS family protein [Candidatus Nezhaarchaeota archaeon]
MKVKVNFVAVLRGLASSPSIEVDLPGSSTVKDVIFLACKNDEKLLERVFEGSGRRVRGDIIVLVDGVDVNLVGGVDAALSQVKPLEITLIPSVHGG